MGGQFYEAPYPPLMASDFAATSFYRISVHNGGRTILIGDMRDLRLSKIPSLVTSQRSSAEIDVAVHGLPGRFVEKFSDPRFEIPPDTIVALLELVGIRRGTPLRLLTCFATEMPFQGLTAAEMLAGAWGGKVSGPNGLLRIRSSGRMNVELVDWVPDVITPGRMIPDNARPGGIWEDFG